MRSPAQLFLLAHRCWVDFRLCGGGSKGFGIDSHRDSQVSQECHFASVNNVISYRTSGIDSHMFDNRAGRAGRVGQLFTTNHLDQLYQYQQYAYKHQNPLQCDSSVIVVV